MQNMQCLKVLKGLRGNGNICMLMRVVTDFNVFDIGILDLFFIIILCLPESDHKVFICSVAIHKYQTISL